MESQESPNIPFTILRTRFPVGMKSYMLLIRIRGIFFRNKNFLTSVKAESKKSTLDNFYEKISADLELGMLTYGWGVKLGMCVEAQIIKHKILLVYHCNFTLVLLRSSAKLQYEFDSNIFLNSIFFSLNVLISHKIIFCGSLIKKSNKF